MDMKQMQAELERVKAENEALKQAAKRKISLKISEKGALSVYGMGRFPVTLYGPQWLTLLDLGNEIRDYIAANPVLMQSKAENLASRPAAPSAVRHVPVTRDLTERYVRQ